MNMRYLDKNEIILPLNRKSQGVEDIEYRQYVEIVTLLKLWRERYGFFKNVKSIRLATEEEDKNEKVDAVLITQNNKEIKVQLKVDHGEDYVHMRDKEYQKIKNSHYKSDYQIQCSYKEADYHSLGEKKIEDLEFTQILCADIGKIRKIIQHSNSGYKGPEDHTIIKGPVRDRHLFKEYFHEDGCYIRVPQDLTEGFCTRWV